MKRLSKINESVFGKAVRRSIGKEERKEDSIETRLNDFVSKHNRDIRNFHIENRVVHSDDYVNIWDDDLIDGKLPFQFGTVNGSFNCSHCEKIISLIGSPQSVNGSFYCSNCDSLTSLEGSTKEIPNGNFFCNQNGNLISLDGAPQKVSGTFSCSFCYSLESLEGSPQEVGDNFECYGCSKLSSLKGGPKKVGNNFNCNACESLTSLDGCPQKVGAIKCTHCGKKFVKSDIPEGTIIENKGLSTIS